MVTVDPHTHTRFFHGFRGRPTPFDPIGAQTLALSSLWAHLFGVALTNHDYYTAFDAVVNSTQFIPGVEVSTTVGHVVIVGPNPPSRTPTGKLTPEEVVSLAHERGCAAIIAHPFRRSRVRGSNVDFDAVEISGKHPEHLRRVRELSTTLDLPIVGGSDAHFPFEVGSAFTRVDIPRHTTDVVVTAILEGRVEPCIRDRRGMAPCERPTDTFIATCDGESIPAPPHRPIVSGHRDWQLNLPGESRTAPGSVKLNER